MSGDADFWEAMSNYVCVDVPPEYGMPGVSFWVCPDMLFPGEKWDLIGWDDDGWCDIAIIDASVIEVIIPEVKKFLQLLGF
jgi:hypothetical protein